MATAISMPASTLPLVENRGKLVLVVDDTVASPLSAELSTLTKDLIGDGWTVLRRDVSRSATPPSVKAVIKAEYNADPTNVKAVFLFGHVPVPYSGNIVPDGHVRIIRVPGRPTFITATWTATGRITPLTTPAR